MQKFKLTFLSFFLSLNLLSFEEFLVSDIRIIGLQRVSTGSIFNVIPISVGDRIDSRKSYDIVKSLFSTEQFDDIQIGKDGNTLIITVVERPSISEIDISGNKALKTEQLIESLDGVGIKEGEVYKRSTLERVKSELVRSYASNGRYGADVEIDEIVKPRNRIEISIVVDEGTSAKIEKINILNKKGKAINFIEKKPLLLKSNMSVLEAIKVLEKFVGENIPVIDEESKVIGVISENDVLKAYSEISGSIRNIEKN